MFSFYDFLEREKIRFFTVKIYVFTNKAEKCVSITAIFTSSCFSAFRELLVCPFLFGFTKHEGESCEGRALLATVIILSSEMKYRREKRKSRERCPRPHQE
jgi:hypothetical protein